MPDTTVPPADPTSSSRTGAPAVELTELTDPAMLAELHTQVLTPSFPPAELVGLDELLAGCASGELQAVGVLAEGRVVAGAVGSAPGEPGGVVLLVYLALAPGQRGGGIGGALLDGAVARWVERSRPAFVLAEIEHPEHHAGSPEHGDPAARLRFYARHGARLLAVPYFQPGIGPQGARVPALLLATLYVDPAVELDGSAETGGPGESGGADATGGSAAEPSATTRVQARPLRDFLVAHLRGSEGTLREDDAVRALLASVGAGSVALLDPDDLDRVPVGLLD